jgi:hypothetical protein
MDLRLGPHIPQTHDRVTTAGDQNIEGRVHGKAVHCAQVACKVAKMQGFQAQQQKTWSGFIHRHINCNTGPIAIAVDTSFSDFNFGRSRDQNQINTQGEF